MNVSLTRERPLVRAALDALGIDRFVLAIHDASFPSLPDEDIGRGSPYSRGAAAFLEFVATLGFDGVQLGPQGKTSRSNASPYDGTFMSRSHLSLALGPLVDEPGWKGLLSARTLDRLVARRPRGARRHASHALAWDSALAALHLAHRRYAASPAAFPAVADEWERFAARRADWLEADGLFEALSVEHGTDDPACWESGQSPALDRRLFDPAPRDRAAGRARRRTLASRHAELIARNTFCQVLLSSQHRQLRRDLAGFGLRLYADLPIGVGQRDAWRYRRLWMPGYVMGAPPSRTNPDGQPWGYPVPDRAWRASVSGRAGPAVRLFERRVDRLFEDFDGLRIDHPHGLVCPWVYRSSTSDPAAAVRAGARLFESPDLPDHPELARLAIARRSDLAPRGGPTTRHADDWVRRLSPAQIARYSIFVDRLMARAAARASNASDIMAEVLSTCPYPLACVLARHGLGRLRVIPKGNPDDSRDPYRTETAAAEDWLTLGTHDTVPVWRAVESFDRERHAAWCTYLSRRLAPSANERSRLAKQLAGDRAALVQAMFADLFVGPARHVTLFFADLLGMTSTFNVPGLVSESNWTLRVPPNTVASYQTTRRAGGALDIPAALAMALRARTKGAKGQMTELATALDRTAR